MPALLWDGSASEGLGTGHRLLHGARAAPGGRQPPNQASISSGHRCPPAALHPSVVGAWWVTAAPGPPAPWGTSQHGTRCPTPAVGARKVSETTTVANFYYFPNFLNVRPLSVYFEFLATESLRIQVERKVSSAGG